MLRAICLLALLQGGTGAAAAQTLLERGDYLVNGILACQNCHTPRGPGGALAMDRQLSGGPQVFDEPSFAVRGANITPDRETGIGAWSDDDIKRALQAGVRPNGVPLAPIMPFPFYKVFTPRDLDAVVAYLRSVAPVAHEVPIPTYKSEMPVAAYPGGETAMSEEQLADPVRRGFYLATIGHCMACHTPKISERQDFANALGKGGEVFTGPFGTSVAPNITSHRSAGIGAWSDAEIKRAITQGISRDGHRLKPPMFFAAYRRLSEPDLDAIVAWLRTLPPLD